jgi:hypothetical protein
VNHLLERKAGGSKGAMTRETGVAELCVDEKDPGCGVRQSLRPTVNDKLVCRCGGKYIIFTFYLP